MITISDFHKANIERCEKYIRPVDSWSALEHAGCAAGELGEMCNFIKKVKRGSLTLEEAREAIGDEIADTISYLSLVAENLDIDIEEALIRKFNKVSDKFSCPMKI